MNFVSACGRLVGVVKSRSSNSMGFSVAEFLEFFEVGWHAPCGYWCTIAARKYRLRVSAMVGSAT